MAVTLKEAGQAGPRIQDTWGPGASSSLWGSRNLYGSDKAPRMQPLAVAMSRGHHGLPPSQIPERFENEREYKGVREQLEPQARQHGTVANNLDCGVRQIPV